MSGCVAKESGWPGAAMLSDDLSRSSQVQAVGKGDVMRKKSSTKSPTVFIQFGSFYRYIRKIQKNFLGIFSTKKLSFFAKIDWKTFRNVFSYFEMSAILTSTPDRPPPPQFWPNPLKSIPSMFKMILSKKKNCTNNFLDLEHFSIFFQKKFFLF